MSYEKIIEEYKKLYVIPIDDIPGIKANHQSIYNQMMNVYDLETIAEKRADTGMIGNIIKLYPKKLMLEDCVDKYNKNKSDVY